MFVGDRSALAVDGENVRNVSIHRKCVCARCRGHEETVLAQPVRLVCEGEDEGESKGEDKG